jgi:hypothetical protein
MREHMQLNISTESKNVDSTVENLLHIPGVVKVRQTFPGDEDPELAGKLVVDIRADQLPAVQTSIASLGYTVEINQPRKVR